MPSLTQDTTTCYSLSLGLSFSPMVLCSLGTCLQGRVNSVVLPEGFLKSGVLADSIFTLLPHHSAAYHSIAWLMGNQVHPSLFRWCNVSVSQASNVESHFEILTIQTES
jgi:hypothetical protein